MATLTKKFHFLTDTESWTGTTETDVFFGWYRTRLGGRRANRTNPPISTYGGSTRFFQRGAVGPTDNYAEWTGTWEDLGVPAGSTITAVNANYLYRWYMRSRSGHSIKSIAAFAGTDTWIGPFELRNSGGSLIDTWSTEKYAITRPQSLIGGDFYWPAYPYDPYDRNVTSISVFNFGAGYTVNDVLTILGGHDDATIRVDSVDGFGGVDATTLLTGGTGYVADLAGNGVSGGTGTGASFTLGITNYWRTEYPISETPASWGLATGTNITGLSHASNTTVKFRINAHLPDETLLPTNTGFVRLKFDHPTFTITYTPPATTFSPKVMII